MNRPLVRRGELRRDSGGGRGGAGRDHALRRVAPGFGHRGAHHRGRLDAHLQRASAPPRWRGRVAPGQLLVLRHLPGTHAALPGSPRLSPAHVGSPRLSRLTSAHLGSPGSPRPMTRPMTRLTPLLGGARLVRARERRSAGAEARRRPVYSENEPPPFRWLLNQVLTRVVGHYPKSNTLLIDCGWTGASAQGKESGTAACRDLGQSRVISGGDW